MSDAVRRESLNTSIPTPLSLPLFLTLPSPVQQHHHLVPPRSLQALSPNDFSKLPRLSPWPYLCFSHSKTVKQPHNRSGALSLIMASVYYCFHAPPHHQPIFPHVHACMRIFKHINEQAHIQNTAKRCMFTCIYKNMQLQG